MSQPLEVSLAECLEVKDRPLEENELWAILAQTLERIDALFKEGYAERLRKLLPITPDSLLLYPNGQTDLTSAAQNSKFYEDCLPPEAMENNSFSTEKLEKMFIYSLGMSVYGAADYGLMSEQELNISPKLDEFLSSMCSKKPGSRINLHSALKTCSDNIMNVTPVLELHRMVLGQTDIEMHPMEEKAYDYSYETFKSNKTVSKSGAPSEASTIHYILLDRGANNHFSMRSNETFLDTFNDTPKSMDRERFEDLQIPSEVDIEETFLKLATRRRGLESLRKGLKKYEGDDHLSLASMNLTRLSNFGQIQSTLNSLDDRPPMDFLSSDYEWLDKRAREIDDWRRNHLQSKEVIITPDPVIRETDLERETLQTDAIEHQNMSQCIPSRGLVYFSEEPQNEHQSKQRSPVREPQSDFYVQKSVTDEEVQTQIHNLVSKAETEENMVGPEFKQTHPVVDLLVREAALVSESNMRHCKVSLLDGSELDVICCPSTTGQQLYECIASYLQLKEPHLFGLALPKGDELQFLNMFMELRKVAPLDWSDKKKFRLRQATPLILRFCVLYFVRSLDYLRYHSTLHLFYLQLRQHLLSQMFQINDIQSNFVVAALALQAEYGRKQDDVKTFHAQDYLPSRIINKSGEVACRNLLLNKWKGMSAIPQRDAEKMFVEKCMSYKEYGYHFYRLSKNTSSPFENYSWIGMGLPGIAVGRDLENSRVLEAIHSWGNTLKLSYNRHRFSVLINNGKTNYYADSYRKCKYLLWLASSQHFFKMAPVSKISGFVNDIDTRLKESERSIAFKPSNALQYEILPKQNSHEPNPLSMPNFSIPSSKQEHSIKPTSLSSSLPLQRDNQMINIQLENQDKLLNYLNQNSQIELQPFNLEEIMGNNSQPAEKDVIEKPPKPHRLIDQAISVKKDTPIENDMQFSPPSEFKAPSDFINRKPPIKAPRLFKGSQSKTYENSWTGIEDVNEDKVSKNNGVPSVVVNDYSNKPQIVIPSFSNKKSSSVLQPVDQMDSSFHESLRSSRENFPLKDHPFTSEVTNVPEVSLESWEQYKRINVTLERKPLSGYGIGLARDRKHEGVFIVSLLSGGVAHLDGRLMPGDEIKVVNGVEVSGSKGYMRAIELMSQPIVTLEVERRTAVKAHSNTEDEPSETKAIGESDLKHLPLVHATLEDDCNVLPPLQHSFTNSTKELDSIPQSANYNENNNNDDSPKREGSDENLLRATSLSASQATVEDDCDLTSEFESSWEDDVLFIGRESSQAEILSIDLQEFQRYPELTKISDETLMEKFEESFMGLKLKNYSGEELKRMADKLEKQLKCNQPLIEFRSLTHPGKNDPCTEGSKPWNRLKNRFQNVLPFDHSRVILKPLQSTGYSSLYTNGYINASHIEYQVGQKLLAFIATQAPLANTVVDFWIMIWQFNVKCIAMLTQEFENGQNKCCHYWPDHKLAVSGRLEIVLIQSHQLEDFDAKFFQIVDLSSGERRLVCLSSFQSWPHDPMVAGSTVSMLKFMSLLDGVSHGAPAVIHCSAGIGRTGVLIVLKICLEFIKCDMKFDLKSIVEELRMQRGGIIQTVQQYCLCCRVILEALKILQRISPPTPP